jgi:hypothetical protein
VTDFGEMIVIDPLGAPMPEQVAEAKASREGFNTLIVIALALGVALLFLVLGIWLGATDPLLWNYVPGVEEPPTVYVENGVVKEKN